MAISGQDHEIKRGAQLIVRESQIAQFVYLGQFGDTFGPGKHTLVTDNIPVLTTLKGWKYGFESPFKADVYFVNTRLFTGNKWGTANPVMMRDQDFGIVRVRAFGTYDFKVVDLQTVPEGSRRHRPAFPARRIRRHHALAHRQRVQRRAGVGEGAGARRGLALHGTGRRAAAGHQPRASGPSTASRSRSFIVENVSVPPEVEQAIDKRSSMSAIGNLNDYVKFQMGQGMEKGTGGAAGTAAEMAVGFGIAQQMMQQGGMTAPAAGGGSAPQAPDLMGLPEAAKYLGVSEADVMASITAGDLKAKKIGSQYRITKAAIDAFLAQ